MPYRLSYHPDVKKVDLPRIDGRNRALIKQAIEERLVQRPFIIGPRIVVEMARYLRKIVSRGFSMDKEDRLLRKYVKGESQSNRSLPRTGLEPLGVSGSSKSQKLALER